MKLEVGGTPTSDLTFLQDQLQRLDPANRSLCFRGFKFEQVDARTKCVDSFLEQFGMSERFETSNTSFHDLLVIVWLP